MGETISREARMTIRQGSQSEPTRPQFVQIPAGHVFFDEDSDYIVMHCVASGSPQPHISWIFNDQPIRANTERVQIHDNGTLVIHNPIEEDEGSYKCEATNYLGSISTVANYKINGKADNSGDTARGKLSQKLSSLFLSVNSCFLCVSISLSLYSPHLPYQPHAANKTKKMKTIGRGKHTNRTGEVAHVEQLAMGANCASGSLGALRCKAVSQY